MESKAQILLEAIENFVDAKVECAKREIELNLPSSPGKFGRFEPNYEKVNKEKVILQAAIMLFITNEK